MLTHRHTSISLPAVVLTLVLVIVQGGALPVPAHAQPGALPGSPGTPDPALDADGKVTTDFNGGPNAAHAIVLQPDEKIVLIGANTDSNSNTDFALARYNSDGSLDLTFDTDGKVTTDFGPADPLPPSDGAGAGAIQADGRIVVVGSASSNQDLALARYNSNGSLDTGFGGDGRVVTDFDRDEVGTSLALQPDGQIVVSGLASPGTVSYYVVARYNPDGTLDATFGDAGKVVGDFNGRGVYSAEIVLQKDGKILLASSTRSHADEGDFALARYHGNGTLDKSFGDGGKAITDIFNSNESSSAVTLQADGKILVAGTARVDGGAYALLARYNPDGTLDTTFGTAGKVVSSFGGHSMEGTAVAVRPNGRILLGGYAWDTTGWQFALERYHSDGSLDTTFGIDGRASTVFDSNDQALAIAVQPDGKILQTGMTFSTASHFDFALVRYLGDETRTVTKADDTDDGVCDSDCSLREAIESAPVDGTIGFDLSLSGQTIHLVSTLVIDKGLTIDGSSLESEIHISGEQAVTVFQIASGVEVTLRSLIIENGLGVQGGGVHIHDQGVLNLESCSLLNNSAGTGGGVYAGNATLRLNHSFVSNNTALDRGGGVYIHNHGAVITGSTLSGNTAERGGGLYINEGTLNITRSAFSGNTAVYGGGMDLGSVYDLALFESTVTGNTAGYGGGLYHDAPQGALTILRSTFSGNQATIGEGGAIYTGRDLYLENSTFYANHAATSGGGIFNKKSLAVIGSTFSENGAQVHGGAVYNEASFTFANTILANSSAGGDCYHSDVVGSSIPYNVNNLVEQNDPPPHGCGVPAVSVDPLLGPLQDNGGPTQTMALSASSPAIDAGDRGNCPPTDQRGVIRPQGDRCDIGAYEVEAPISIHIGGMPLDAHLFARERSQRVSFPGVNGGPVILSTFDGTPLVASERVIYRVNGVNTSFSEIMAVPFSGLDTVYWLPWYNNADLDTQLRMTNISGSPTVVNVTVAGLHVAGGYFLLGPGESIRKSFPGVNNGPLKVVSELPLALSARVIYKPNGVPTSFSEMTALQNNYLDTTYWLPWYNNVDMDTQLRIANVTDEPAQVAVTIGGVPMPSFSLDPGASTRLRYAGVNAGPVKIVSTTDIVASARVIYKVNRVPASFSEMMALPQNRLNFTYWLPWYNSVGLDTQLRVANPGMTPATVHVTLRGAELPGSPFTVEAGQSARKSFPGVNDGPLHIFSDTPIVVSARVIYRVNGVVTSFSETMPLAGNPLITSYVLPWYNNVDLDTQLRVGVPSE
jgi:uncharacterized delta-60 repeat protein/CSLREA domain-containing protein